MELFHVTLAGLSSGGDSLSRSGERQLVNSLLRQSIFPGAYLAMGNAKSASKTGQTVKCVDTTDAWRLE